MARRLDQLVPGLGYHIENTIPCCHPCNRARGTRSLSEELARRRIGDPDYQPYLYGCAWISHLRGISYQHKAGWKEIMHK